MRASLPTAALLILVSLSGCRFGNYVENAPPVGPTVAYYEMQPETLDFCATSGNETRCEEQPTNRIPGLLSQPLTNPVRLLRDPESGAALFTPPQSDTIGLSTFFKNETEIDYLGHTDVSALWNDTRCTTQLYLIQQGRLQSGGPFLTGSTLPLSGRIETTVQVTRFFDAATPGACDATLSAIRDCLNNLNACGGSQTATHSAQQQVFQSYFADFFTAGVLTVDQVPTVRNLSYVVQYR